MSKSNKQKDEKIKVINRFISVKEVKKIDIDLKEVEVKLNSKSSLNVDEKYFSTL